VCDEIAINFGDAISVLLRTSKPSLFIFRDVILLKEKKEHGIFWGKF